MSDQPTADLITDLFRVATSLDDTPAGHTVMAAARRLERQAGTISDLATNFGARTEATEAEIERLRATIESLAAENVKLRAVASCARNPDCNFDSERECGFVQVLGGEKYRHHPERCPAGRLQAALAKLDKA